MESLRIKQMFQIYVLNICFNLSSKRQQFQMSGIQLHGFDPTPIPKPQQIGIGIEKCAHRIVGFTIYFIGLSTEVKCAFFLFATAR